MGKITETVKGKILSAANEGLPVPEISRVFIVSQSSVYNVLKELNFDNGKTQRDKKILSIIENGGSYSDAGLSVGVSPSSARAISMRHGVRKEKLRGQVVCRFCRNGGVRLMNYGKGYYSCAPCNTERMRKYCETQNGREKVRSAVYNSINRHKDRQSARKAVEREVQSGRVTRPAKCSKCGDKNCATVAHHKDYSQPLDVEWLCLECHRAKHHTSLTID